MTFSSTTININLNGIRSDGGRRLEELADEIDAKREDVSK